MTSSAPLLSLLLLSAAGVEPALAVNGRPTEGISNAELCASKGQSNGSYTLGLRIAAIFVVMVSSSLGVVLPFVPVWSKGRLGKKRNAPVLDQDGLEADYNPGHGHSHGSAAPISWWDEAFFVSKYFGAGVILATAFVHLTYEAFVQLSSPCIHLAYAPAAPAISMASLFLIFLVDLMLMRHLHRRRKAFQEVKARRARTKAQLESLTLNSIRPIESLAMGGPLATPANPYLTSVQGRVQPATPDIKDSADDDKERVDPAVLSERLRREELLEQEERETDARLEEKARELDVMVIEGGIVFHSVMVGLGLGTSSDAGFVPYFVAIVFHQMFDGFAIGTRMVALNFEGKRRKQAAMFLAYALVTPVGISIGTGVRTVFAPNDPTTIIAIGVLDSISAGVLLYGALVDLLAKDFLFGDMLNASDKRLGVALFSLLLGAGVMSLLGKWA